MALFNTLYMMKEYVSDFGVTFNNIGIKIQSDAPELSSLYQTRPGGQLCSSGKLFTPRHLEVVFKDGKKLKYPVPKLTEIENFVKKLMPSLFDTNLNGDNDAACINLVGERWTSVYSSIAAPKLDKQLTIPTGSIKKTTGSIKYKSDILGETRIPVKIDKTTGFLANVLGDLDTIINCQKKGFEDFKDSSGICTAGGDIVPRRILMSIAIKNTQNKDGFTITTRQAICSTNDGNLIQDFFANKQPIDVAKAVESCSRCIGYAGEDVINVHLAF